MAFSASNSCIAAIVALCIASSAASVAGAPMWRAVGPARADDKVTLTFGLRMKQGAHDALAGACKQVSDPHSEQYGMHLSLEDVAALSADASSLSTVREWLTHQGVAEGDIAVSRSRDVLTARVTTAKAGELLGTDMHTYQHVDAEHARIVRAAPHHVDRHRGSATAMLPERVRAATEVFLGATDMPPLNPAGSRPNKAAARLGELPADVKEAIAATVEDAQAAADAGNDDDPYQPGAAVMLFLLGNSTTADVLFLQFCKDGMLAKSFPPCSQDGQVAVAGYKASILKAGSDAPEIMSLPLGNVVSAPPPAPGVAGFILQVPALVPFQKVQINISAAFADGSVGKAGHLNYTNVPAQDRFILPSPGVPPNMLREFYGYTAVDASKIVEGNSQSVVEFSGQFYSPQDLQDYFQRNSVQTEAKVTVVGPNNASNPGGEAQLDIQLIMGLAPNVNTVFWSTPDDSPNGGFVLDWAFQIGNSTNPPLVHSISYGAGEDVFTQLGNNYIPRTNAEFAKMCARGLSVVVATGDGGSTNVGHGASACEVVANFPSDSPFITAVSASQLSKVAASHSNSEDLGEECVSVPEGRQWTTGGGFSNTSTAPWYQQEAVKSYLSSGAKMPPSNLFNAAGRAYPDVTAIGHNHLIVDNGMNSYGDGTSASAPAFAAAISLLNNARLSAGKSPVGFLNPALYDLAAKNPAAFYDITIGSNECGQMECCPHGYGATKGFDVPTGLGSIGDLKVLVDYVMALP